MDVHLKIRSRFCGNLVCKWPNIYQTEKKRILEKINYDSNILLAFFHEGSYTTEGALQNFTT
jgi:hypothetical protein